MAILFVMKGPGAGQEFSLEGHRLVMIGRDARCTLQIVDPQLSRNHLQIKYVEEERRHYAIDFQSKNGVKVNDKKIDAPTLLGDRDVIVIGDTTLVYSTDDAHSAQDIRESMKRFGQGHVQTRTGD
jgi:pSer/pThr/pTyr-binding forkhead associated (FHA) protein